MFPYPIYFTPISPQPPPGSHPRPSYPYYGYRPGTGPQLIYPQPASAPVPIFASQAFIAYPVSQTPSPTPLPVPADTPNEVRYEIIGGVLTPIRHFYSNSPAGAGRGYSPHGFDTGSLPPGWGTTPPAPEAPAVRDPAPASSQVDAQPDTGTGDRSSPEPENNAPASSDTTVTTMTDDPAPNSGSSTENAPPSPPRPTVEDEAESKNGGQAPGAGTGSG